jgi:hypothetical protein
MKEIQHTSIMKPEPMHTKQKIESAVASFHPQQQETKKSHEKTKHVKQLEARHSH